MRDRYYQRENGEEVTVSLMTTAEIHELMTSPFEVYGDCTVPDAMLRLEIELIIRRIDGR